MAGAVIIVMPRLVVIVIAVRDKFTGVVVVVAGVVVVGATEVAGAARVEIAAVVTNTVVAIVAMTVTVVASAAADAKTDSKPPRLRSRRTQDRKSTNNSTRKQCPSHQTASLVKLRIEVISILTSI
mgnify:CR=1 FL=1